jgi:hypothetical protein
VEEEIFWVGMGSEQGREDIAEWNKLTQEVSPQKKKKASSRSQETIRAREGPFSFLEHFGPFTTCMHGLANGKVYCGFFLENTV